MLLGGIAILSAAAACLICGLTGVFGDLSWLLWLPVSFVGSYLILAALTFFFVWFMCAIVDLKKPQKKDNAFYRAMVSLLAKAAMKILLMRVHTVGLEKTPKSGRFFLVCNHINDLDPVTLMAYFSQCQLAFITKRENMSMFLVGKLMHKILCQPINRENDREALKTILKCIQLLKDDMASVAAFPEGYTSVDGLLHHFRHGIFKIATKAKVPIVVCTLQNTNKPFKNVLKLKTTDVHLHLLEVIQPEDYEGKTAVEIGEYVYNLMAEDLGPGLVLQPQ